MPELPEVEVARRMLEHSARGRTIARVRVEEPRVLRGQKAKDLQALKGARFRRFDRLGKHLLLTLGRGTRPVGLWSHLGMTGKWLVAPEGAPAPRFSRVAIKLDSGATLHYADMRLFGRLGLVEGARFQQLPEIAALGPDPLHAGVSARDLGARLSRSRRSLKLDLMDQGILAGLGNIQVSEALFRARLDPRRASKSLTPAELKRLVTGIRGSLAATIRRFDKEAQSAKGRSIAYVEEPGTPNPFLVYGKAGLPCPNCRRQIIRRLVQGGRASFFCSRCQR